MLQDILSRVGVTIDVAFNLIFLSLIWVRVLSMASVIPFITGKPVPRSVVVGASMVMAVFVFPNIVPLHPPPLADDFLKLFMLYIKEVFYGISIGFSVAILFYGFESAGQMIDNQRGMSIARLLIPQLGEQGSLTGSFLFQLAIVVYLSIGGHRLFFSSFFMSFKTLPVLDFPSVGPGLFPMVDLFIKISGEVLLIALQLAAPVIIAIFVADIILGVANRVAPQINVWELGFNVKGYVGILMLLVSITMIGDQIRYYSIKSNRYSDRVIENLQGKVQVEGEEPVKMPEEGLPKPKTVTPPVISPQ
jgi:flagellar biosynthetic protein FliR